MSGEIKYFDYEVQNYNFLLNYGKSNKNSNYIEGGDAYNILIKSKLNKVN